MLIGRDPELEVLGSELEQARAGCPRVVLVAGEAGIGKTALLHHFEAKHESELLWLRASGDEGERMLAFGVLEQLVAGLSVPLTARLSSIVAGAVAAPDPLAMGMEFLDVLGVLQDDGPVAIVLDDAPWADGPSLSALTFALRRLRADRVLTLVAFRPGAEAALPPGLLRLADRGRGRMLSLAGLEPPELQSLSAATGTGELSPRTARRLHVHTQGNPLYALSLLKEGGAEALRDHKAPTVPPSLSVLLLRRLAPCSAEAVALVEAAAVLGRHCTLGVASRLAGLHRPLEALEETINACVLTVEAGGDGLAFTHPLLHSAVYADMGPPLRSKMHTRAAELLVGNPALDHRVRAARPEDAALAEELRKRVGEETGLGAWPAAARHLLAAGRLDPTPGAREDCLLQAATLMLHGLDISGVLSLLDEIAALPPSCRRNYVLGHVALLSGRIDEAELWLREAFEARDPPCEDAIAAACAAQLAQCSVFRARGLDAVEVARTAIRLAPASSPALGFARATLMVGMGIAGRAQEAVALVFPDVAGGLPGITEFQGWSGRGVVRLWTDDLPGAIRDLSAATRHMAQIGLGYAIPTLFHLAEAEFRAGAWDDALAHAHHATSLAEDADALYATPLTHSILATIHALRGQWNAAEEEGVAALAGARARGDPSSLAYACTAAAHLALARADPAGMLAAVDPLVRLGECDGISEPGVVPWRDLHIEALIRLGRLDDAEKELLSLEARAQERELGSGLAAAALARGCLEAARGAKAEARTAFRTGLERARELGMPFVRSRIATELGAFLRRCGERRAAAARFDEAAGLLRALGAEPFLDRCERELELCGLRPSPRGTAHLSLTPQELGVARLVSRGLRNREVAAELVLSVKTVEYHLSNVFAKLGVGSRTQLVARLGGGEDPAPPR